MENKQTAVEWYWDKIKSHFEHDGDLYEVACMTYAIAKEKEKEQHGQTWDKSLDNLKARGMNEMRAYCDFDDYYQETYK